MPARFVVLAVTLASLAAAGPASAQQDYLFGERNFRNACPPPLNYAAGACVRRCPAGYRLVSRGYCRPPNGPQR